jgi:TetR/AcrR family transcriptional regulator
MGPSLEARPAARRPGRPTAAAPAVPDEGYVLRKGLEAFAELGYDRASARELARRMNVSHNFIHDRYGSKMAFWRAVIDYAQGSQLAPVPAEHGDLSDTEYLQQVVASFYRSALDWPHLGRVCMYEFSRDSERLDYLYDRYIAPLLAAVEGPLGRVTSAGGAAPMPADVFFYMAILPSMGLVLQPLARRLAGPRGQSREQRLAEADRLAAAVVNRILPPPAAGS